MSKTHVVLNHNTGKVVLTDNFDNCKEYTVWANRLSGQFHRVYPIIGAKPNLSLQDREFSLISRKPLATPDPTISPIRGKINRRMVSYQ